LSHYIELDYKSAPIYTLAPIYSFKSQTETPINKLYIAKGSYQAILADISLLLELTANRKEEE
jgi:hypothetical protein